MQKIFLNILITGILISLAAPLKAQVRFNVNANIGSQPIWGPVGYDAVQYYYLPAIDTYYDVPQHLFIYQVKGRWITSAHLPRPYRNYDLYRGYKVVINENRPYLRNRVYKEKYGSYKDRHNQRPIRDSRDSKYFVNKKHPEHNNWMKQHSNDKGNAKVQGKGNKHKDKKK